MKTISIFLMLILLVFSMHLTAQEVTTNLDEARSSYNAGDLENTRFTLQEALNGINETIGYEILETLPVKLGDMEKVEGSDAVTGTNMGFAGLYVSREFKGDSTTASFQIISDSPLLSSISAMLSMSVFFASDPDQKRIKIDGYKALLTRNEDEQGRVSYDTQLPFGNSLMNIEITGIKEEKKVTGVLDEVPVGQVVEIAK